MLNVVLMGTQIRIDLHDRDLFFKATFKTLNCRAKGRFQEIIAKQKYSGVYATQSWHINLTKYANLIKVKDDLSDLLQSRSRPISFSEYSDALDIAREWFNEK